MVGGAKNKQELQSLLGMFNYLIVPNLAAITKDLGALVKKNAD